jgi:glycosyltransferase involved in cell wall biosynthesis
MPLPSRLLPGARPVVVFEAHEYPRDWRRAKGLRYVDAIVAITHAAAEELHTRLGFPRERILVAADGVPDAWLATIDKTEARQRLNLRAERPLAVYTGNVHPDTVPLLFQTAEALRDRADVVVVGAPPGDPAESAQGLRDLQDAARSRGLSMLFVGGVRVDDVRWYQAAADVLLAPYSGTLRWARYASPLKVFEYMAARRPMVVSDLPVLHEVLRHDENAWFVPAADGFALAEGVMRLLDHPDAAGRIASAAHERAHEYTWSRRARAVIGFLEKFREPRR